MQLTEIELENWGPFYQNHQIPLSVDESAPVVLFRGENMRGKTSLLRAIVWCLYGELREQDGRTPLEVARMVNIDAVQGGETQFGVRLRFVHDGAEMTLYRSGTALEERPGRVVITHPKLDLIATGAPPYPVAQIPDVINTILSREISDFFLFDGEMLNRFEERLREERAASQGFVRAQVERALGLPFLSDLSSDLDAVLSGVTATIEQVLRKSKAHEQLSQQWRAKKDEMEATERDLQQLREHDEDLGTQIDSIEAQLSRVDEIKDLYHERKRLERDADASRDTVKDYQEHIAERAEATWWLPAADVLIAQLEETEDSIVSAEETERERILAQARIEQIERQIGTGTCPTCGQSLVILDEVKLRDEMKDLVKSQARSGTTSLDDLRRRRDRLRRFSTAPSTLQWLHDQERDLRRERLRHDKCQQRILQISEQLSGNTVEIETLERNLIDLKINKSRSSGAIAQLEEKRTRVKQEAQKLGSKLADLPEVDPGERGLQRTADEALEIVNRSFDHFRAAMRERVRDTTSDLFRRLTTEKEYSGVAITDDYLLAVTDHLDRPLDMISAGANQILTMAFIGALAACSVDEAPMVMDTPFGRLDVGHRSAILEWVSTFESQVILFVQSGEYDPSRDTHLLRGKIGREYTIERLTPNRSEVKPA